MKRVGGKYRKWKSREKRRRKCVREREIVREVLINRNHTVYQHFVAMQYWSFMTIMERMFGCFQHGSSLLFFLQRLPVKPTRKLMQTWANEHMKWNKTSKQWQIEQGEMTQWDGVICRKCLHHQLHHRDIKDTESVIPAETQMRHEGGVRKEKRLCSNEIKWKTMKEWWTEIKLCHMDNDGQVEKREVQEDGV